MKTSIKLTAGKTATLLAILFAGAILFTSCKKDPGPQGPQGPQGPSGPAAQVQTFTMSTSWTHMGTNGQVGDGYAATFNCPAITSSIMGTGTVLVYFSGSPANVWGAVPYSEPKGSYNRFWTYAYYPGQFEVDVQDSDLNTTDPLVNYGTLYFKVVIISGNQKKANPHIKWSNYAEVKSVLGLKD